MVRHMRTLLVVLLTGCGGVHYSGTTSRGTACADASIAWCDRLIACALAPMADRSTCITQAEDGCCGNTQSCGDPVASPLGAMACVNSLPTTDCAALGTSSSVTLPANCKQMF
jgi:hypothetical protein